jgi:arginase family enzyme
MLIWLMEILGDSGLLCSPGLMQINPILDRRNQTSELALELAA